MESSEKLLKQILAELQAIRRNQEARMSAGELESVKASRLRGGVSQQEPDERLNDSEHERVNRRLSGLKTKGG